MKPLSITSFWKFLFPLLASGLCFGAQPDRITGPIDSSQTVVLARSVHPKAQPQYDLGAVEPSLKLSYITLLTVPSASQQNALDQLLSEQQDPTSPNYHKWLTPEQFADQFGLSQNDVNKITGWLKSQGLTVLNVARGRNAVILSSTVAQVQRAFKTEIHNYSVNGEKHIANSTPVTVPAALNGIVTGVRGLNDFRPKPHVRPLRSDNSGGPHPNYTLNTAEGPEYFSAPGDIATIYGINSLYNASPPINGTGQKLAVMGQTDIYLADLTDFRSGFNLPSFTCTTGPTGLITSCPNATYFSYVLLGTDPGSPLTLGDLFEADLDVEWTGAIARNAQIIFVNAETAGGVSDAISYAIDNKTAPVITISYGICEAEAAPFQETEFQMGNAEGLTLVAAAGDDGAADCDENPPGTSQTPPGSPYPYTLPPPYSPAVGGWAVDYPGSSPEFTSAGGTAIPLNNLTSTYWSTTNGANGGSATQYIPEAPWNDDEEIAQYCISNPGGSCAPSPGVPITSAQTYQEDYWIAIGGGGVSNCYNQTAEGICESGFTQPQWQQALTIPGLASPLNTYRFVPDVALLASPSFPGYIICTPVEELVVALPSQYSTDTASSCADGIAAAVTGNNFLYPSVAGGTSASAQVFGGMVTLLNQYLGGAGLGNINPMLYTLAATAANGAFHQVVTGDNVVYCQPGTPAAQPTSAQCPAGGSLGFFASNADATTGYNLVTGLGSLNVNNLAVAWAARIQKASFTVGGSAAVATAGSSGISTITLTPSGGFTGQVAVTCVTVSLPPGVSCSPNPLDIDVTSSGAADGQLTLNVTAPSAPGVMAEIRRGMDTEYASLQGPPSGRNGWWKLSAGSGLAAIFLVLLPGRRRYRATLSLWLICVLSFAMGCGSSSSPSTVAAETTTKITAPVTKAASGTSLNFNVAVTLVSSGALAGNGMVQLLDGGNLVATVSAVNGVATFTNIASLSVGTHAISASYLGDASTLASQSGAVNVTVTGTTTVGISTNPASSNSNATISLTVN